MFTNYKLQILFYFLLCSIENRSQRIRYTIKNIYIICKWKRKRERAEKNRNMYSIIINLRVIIYLCVRGKIGRRKCRKKNTESLKKSRDWKKKLFFHRFKIDININIKIYILLIFAVDRIQRSMLYDKC